MRAKRSNNTDELSALEMAQIVLGFGALFGAIALPFAMARGITALAVWAF